MSRNLVFVMFSVLLMACACKNSPEASKVQDDGGAHVATALKNFMESDLDSDYRDAVNALHGCSDKICIDEKLRSLNSREHYEGFSTPKKFLSILSMPVYKSRSIVYKFKPILFPKNDPSDSLARSGINFLLSQLNLATPAQSWSAAFDFVAEPFPDNRSDRFKTMSDFREFLVGAHLSDGFAGTLRDMIQKLEDLKPSLLNQKIKGYIVHDLDAIRGVAPGIKRIVHPEDRYVAIGLVEIEALIASLFGALHNIHFFAAYNTDDFFDLSDDVLKMAATDKAMFSSGSIYGVTSKKLVSKYNEYPGFLKLERPDHLHTALVSLQQSVESIARVWEGIKRRNDGALDWENTQKTFNRFVVLNPTKIIPWTDINSRFVSDLKEVVLHNSYRSGKVEGYTGSLVKFDFHALYNMPEKSLQKFFPVDWNREKKVSAQDESGKKTRNYRYEQATHWDGRVYSKYFGNVPTDSRTDKVPREVRALRQLWSGWIVAGPFTPVM